MDKSLGIFASSRPYVIAGPCSAESEEQLMRTALALKADGVEVFRAGLWKPRTRPGCFEGVGAVAVPWMQRVRKETGMRICTEVANASHVQLVADAGFDMVWIGARTTANPFLVEEIAKALESTEMAVMVKNPVSSDLELWAGAVERLRRHGVTRIGLIHRGFTTSTELVYRNAPEWHIAIEMRRRYPEMPLVCDPSHMGGDRAYVKEISQKALDLGFDGLMIESHCTPDCALSDAAQQLTPQDLEGLLHALAVRLEDCDDDSYRQEMAALRARMDLLDSKLVEALASRMEISREIGRLKKQNNISILQIDRWQDVMDQVGTSAVSRGIDPDFVIRIFNEIHRASVAEQNKILNSDDCQY